MMHFWLVTIHVNIQTVQILCVLSILASIRRQIMNATFTHSVFLLECTHNMRQKFIFVIYHLYGWCLMNGATLLIGFFFFTFSFARLSFTVMIATKWINEQSRTKNKQLFCKWYWIDENNGRKGASLDSCCEILMKFINLCASKNPFFIFSTVAPIRSQYNFSEFIVYFYLPKWMRSDCDDRKTADNE